MVVIDFSPTSSPHGTRTPAEEAILAAVMYADIFDFPLTRDEVFLYLMAPASREAVDAAIDRLLETGDDLAGNSEFLYLRGREETVAVRKARSLRTGALWKRARLYARVVWAIPYVRMVAVTGSLAVDNAGSRADIDLLVVTHPGRLWLSRGLIVLLSRLIALGGERLCPNYLITTRALALEGRDIYSAHELAQMVPLHGSRVAERLWAQNRWCRNFLPNATWRAVPKDDLPLPAAAVKQIGELILSGAPGDWIEAWERRRKVAKLSGQAPDDAETAYTADVCKGHQNGHAHRVLRLFAARLAALQRAGDRHAYRRERTA